MANEERHCWIALILRLNICTLLLFRNSTTYSNGKEIFLTQSWRYFNSVFLDLFGKMFRLDFLTVCVIFSQSEWAFKRLKFFKIRWFDDAIFYVTSWLDVTCTLHLVPHQIKIVLCEYESPVLKGQNIIQ